MGIMQSVGNSGRPPSRAQLREDGNEYVIGLVSGFTEDELTVEALGSLVIVRGDRVAPSEDEGPYRLHERLEESFRLPDDADLGRLRAVYGHGSLEIHAPRLKLRRRFVSVELESLSFINADATHC